MNTTTTCQLPARQVTGNRKKQNAKVRIWLRAYTALFNNTMTIK
ncbi:hypothetical protein [Alteromonas antoniana]|nr:hypothetical protein [Alteromonas antoniana]